MASSDTATAAPGQQHVRVSASGDHFDAHSRAGTPGRGAKSRSRGGRQTGASPGRGGRGGRPESRSQQPGRWGHAPLPPEPVLPDNARQFGVVVTVKETFGFIKCYTGRRDQVFFHGSELQALPQPSATAGAGDVDSTASPADSQQPQQQQGQRGGRPDLPSMVQPGTPVEFTVIEGDPAQNRRTVAVQVRVLPPFMDTLQRGTVERDLRGGHKRREDAYGGRISWLSPLPLPTPPTADGAAGDAAAPASDDSPASPAKVSAAAEAAAAALAGTSAEVEPAHLLPPGLGHSAAANGTSESHKPAAGDTGSADASAAAAASGPEQKPGQKADQAAAPQQLEASRQQEAGGQQEAGRQQQPERQVIGLPFEGGDIGADQPRLRLGDEVEFRVTLDRRSGQLKATEVTLVKSAHPDSPPAAAAASGRRSSGATGARENGFVASLKDNFGFLICADRDARLFFHFSEAGFPKSKLAEGAEVSFSATVDEESGREAAVALQLLPPGTIAAAADTPLPGPVRGRMVRPATEARSRQVQDGVAAFVDDAGLEFHCSYGNHQLPEGAQHPAEGDEVQLSVVHNTRTGARRATAVSLLTKAADRRELGQVKVLKNNWGLIRAVERPMDVFFHASSLAEGLDFELKVGDDVEFTVVRDPEALAKDPNTKKLAAVRVMRAPAGSAVFETLSEGLLEGKVVERLQVNRGTTVVPGAVEYLNEAGMPSRLAYGLRDLADGGMNPAVGEPVTFRLAVNHAAVKAAAKAGGLAAAHAGRRATQVGPPVVEGVVVSTKGHYGFAEIDAEGAAKLGLGEHTRMFFHMSQVQDDVKVGRGDTVSMVVTFNARSGERSGARVKRIKEADKEAQKELEKPEFTAERNPNAIKYIGNKVEVQTMPQPRMPDGTRGFEPGPWCEQRKPQRSMPPLPAAAAAVNAERDAAASGPAMNGAHSAAASQQHPAAAQRQAQQQQPQPQQQRQQGLAQNPRAQPPRPPLPAPRQMATAFGAAAAVAEPPAQPSISPPPGHQRRLSSSRLGSGLLKADAPEFVPRAGSVASDIGAFLTPAASLSELGLAQLQLQQQPASRVSLDATEQSAGHRRDASDSSAFFTPAASLAVAGLDSTLGLQPAQLRAAAARLEQDRSDTPDTADGGSTRGSSSVDAEGGPGAEPAGDPGAQPAGGPVAKAAADSAAASAADGSAARRTVAAGAASASAGSADVAAAAANEEPGSIAGSEREAE